MAAFDELYGVGFPRVRAISRENPCRDGRGREKGREEEIFAAAVVKPEEANPYAEVLEVNGREQVVIIEMSRGSNLRFLTTAGF